MLKATERDFVKVHFVLELALEANGIITYVVDTADP